MERREFLRHAAAGAVAAATGRLPAALAGEAAPERRNERPAMRYARLGRTNLMVSRIVHGSLHTTRERIPLLARLYDGGVNLFDTSHVYGGGRSEEAIGEFLAQDGRRRNAFICTKMDIRAQLQAKQDPYKAAMERAEGSLRRLRTDHVDIMMLHGCTTLFDYVNNEEWLRAAEDLKRQGKARFIGLSEHARPAEVLQLAITSGRYDVAMVAFSLVKGTWGSLGRTDIPTMQPALDAARKADVGIIVMKAAMNAPQIVAQAKEPRLQKKGYSPFQLCYRYVLDIPGVAAVTCGMVNMSQAEENLAVPTLELAAEEREGLHRAAAAGGVCGFCGMCLNACPARVAVQDILRFHSYYRHGHRAEARAEYAGMATERRAPACRGCGACEAACPARVPIRRSLQEAHRALA